MYRTKHGAIQGGKSFWHKYPQLQEFVLVVYKIQNVSNYFFELQNGETKIIGMNKKFCFKERNYTHYFETRKLFYQYLDKKLIFTREECNWLEEGF